MSDEDRTEPHARAAAGQPEGVVAGETALPLEHTARVRAARPDPERTHLTVHDDEPAPAPRSSTELAERSRRQRRRERDRRAERRAILLVAMVFVGLGGAALVAVNVLLPEETSPAVAQAPAPGEAPETPAVPARPSGVITTRLEETPDLPVLSQLSKEGLTIGAEGLPEVLALTDGPDIAKHAALESCRFAYAVWELSPNKRFRFLTTCGALEGQILVGAYVVQGTKVRMSPIGAQGLSLTTELDLEKPTRATTSVGRVGDPTPMLAVKQRLTAIRPGLQGGAFYESFAPRNTITPRRGRPATGAAPAAPRPAPPPRTGPRDPVLDLLGGQQ